VTNFEETNWNAAAGALYGPAAHHFGEWVRASELSERAALLSEFHYDPNECNLASLVISRLCFTFCRVPAPVPGDDRASPAGTYRSSCGELSLARTPAV
jgi:hypothetical protein